MKPCLSYIFLTLIVLVPHRVGLAQVEDRQEAFSPHEVVEWAANLKCAQRRFPENFYSQARDVFSEIHGVKTSDLRSGAEALIETSTTHRLAYKTILDNCPEKRLKPKLLSQSHAIYLEVQCMVLKGLSRRDWQSRVQDIYDRYKTSAEDYVSAKRELMEDPLYQSFVHKVLANTCPSEVQKRRLILERKTSLRDGHYIGDVSGLEGQKVRVEIVIDNKVIVTAKAHAFGHSWPLRPRSSGNKMSLSGKAGDRTLFFKGRMRSGSFTGRFYARISGQEIKGRWTATRIP